MFKFLQKGVTDPSKQYIAAPKDASLQSLLHEAFKVLEHRFANFDHDKAETLMYKELERELSMMGFRDGDKLAQIFKRVDFDGNGTLDFSEFLALLYLWAMNEGGDYSAFFRHPTNAAIIKKAFETMETSMLKYDVDRSRKLSIDELDAFFNEQLPQAVKCGAYKEIADETFPKEERAAGGEINFPRFMHMLYICMSKMEGNRVPGKYASPIGVAKEEYKKQQASKAKGAESPTWKFLRSAFKVLETDFARFDQSGDNYIDYSELSMGVPQRAGFERFQILSRLEHKFKLVDVDKSHAVDFFEFLYLGFLMTQEGCYSDLVEESEGQAMVMRAFVDIHSYYIKCDANQSKRLEIEDVESFSNMQFGEIPERLHQLFKENSYVSSQSKGAPVVDIMRFMKMLYLLTCEDGRYVQTKALKPGYDDKKHLIQKQGETAAIQRPPRISPVVNAKFQKSKKLGEGGQGAVYLGTYESQKVAGKVMFGKVTKEVMEDLENEVELFMKLDHPNCHYMLGAKLVADAEGPLLLTEVCDEGSLFDLYAKKQKKFDPDTALRIAKECAMGLEHLHSIGYMHRDVKSLNVFMASGYVAKVADFGMATTKPTCSDACGTVQWMAPEVLANFYHPGSTPYDKRCDVYSYGIMLWEIYHCSCPFAETGLDQMQIARAVNKNGIRPRMKDSIIRPIKDLISLCWAKRVASRPLFSEIIMTLNKIGE
uniref:Calmodulin n=1 Tax=Hemiselmis andersenii TaxID=464988 RepID=A0A7S1HLU3_HEMAN|mmetsp:Transcript_7498/g.18195  ORF Transcript_7498/g.18195 Transcript_7498/m.18195 type:complete len:711 (+) Transcript_7498:81-2213(+)